MDHAAKSRRFCRAFWWHPPAHSFLANVDRGCVRDHCPIHFVRETGRVASIRLGSRSKDIAKPSRFGDRARGRWTGHLRQTSQWCRELTCRNCNCGCSCAAGVRDGTPSIPCVLGGSIRGRPSIYHQPSWHFDRRISPNGLQRFLFSPRTQAKPFRSRKLCAHRLITDSARERFYQSS